MESSYPWLSAINAFNASHVIPIIVVVGMIGNLLALAVLVITPLKQLSLSVYLAALSLTDFVFLIFLGIGWMDGKEVSVFYLVGMCQLVSFMTYTVSFLSIWFVVVLNAKFYSSICFARLHRMIGPPKMALRWCVLLVTTACLIYSFSLWHSRSVKTDGDRYVCVFTETPSTALIISIVDIVLTLVVPCTLLLFMNFRIVFSLTQTRRSLDKKHGRKEDSMRLMSSTPITSNKSMHSKLTTQPWNSLSNKLSSDQSRRMRNGVEEITPDSDQEEKQSPEDIILDKIARRYQSEMHEIHINAGNTISLTMLDIRHTDLNQVSTKSLDIIDITHSMKDVTEGHCKTGDDVNRSDRKSREETNSVLRSTSSSRKTLTPQREHFSKNRRKSLNKQQQKCWNSEENERDSSATFIKRHSIELINKTQRKTTAADNIVDKERVTTRVLNRITNTDKNNKNVSNTNIKNSNNNTSNVGIHKDGIEDDQTWTTNNGGHKNNKYNNKNTARQTSNNSSHTSSTIRTVSSLQRKCLKMVVAITTVFLALNLPSHAIRLQSLVRGLFQPNYTTSELEYELLQLFQTVYYLNFVVNIFIYSACAKSFQRALIRLPHHFVNTFSVLCAHVRVCEGCRRSSQHYSLHGRVNSRMVDICIDELHLSQLPSFGPDFKWVSPPCLIQLESDSNNGDVAGDAGGGGDGGDGVGGGNYDEGGGGDGGYCGSGK